MLRRLQGPAASLFVRTRFCTHHSENRQAILTAAGGCSQDSHNRAITSTVSTRCKPQQRPFTTRAAHSAGTSSSDLPRSSVELGMDSHIEELVRQIHASPTRAVFYVAGGGLQALTWLLVVPGASNTVLESRVPYGGGKSMSEILGREPEKFASTQTAVDMARSAYRQAAHLSSFGTAILGVSCTCALATDRIKKGDHKVCIATHNGQTTKAYSLRLSKGSRDRISEDAVASRLVLRALAEGCGLQQRGELDLQLLPSANGTAPSHGPTEVVQETVQSIGDPLEALLEGTISSVEFSGGQVICNAARRNRVYLPGSFNPLHDGHRRLLAAGCKSCGQPNDGCFELSAGNPDKGMLPLEDVQKRVQQFVDAGLPLVVTQAPLYVNKAKLFAKSTFVVGYDTAIRLVMPKYYGSRTLMLLELAALRHRGCKFLVAGRVGDDGKFLTLADVDVPEEIASQGLFEEILESVFREDISSTELRQQGKGLA